MTKPERQRTKGKSSSPKVTIREEEPAAMIIGGRSMAQRRRRMTGFAFHATSQAISPKIVAPREPRAKGVERRERVEEEEDEGRMEEDDGALKFFFIYL